MGWELGPSPYFNWACVLGIHAPVRAINVMRAPTRDHSCSKLFAAQPARTIEVSLRMHALFRAVNIGSRTQPHVVVQIFGNGHFRLIVTGRIPGQSNLYRLQLSDAAVANQFSRIAKLYR